MQAFTCAEFYDVTLCKSQVYFTLHSILPRKSS